MISVWVNEWGHEKEETNKQTIGSTDKRLMEWMNAWIDLGIKTLYWAKVTFIENTKKD